MAYKQCMCGRCANNLRNVNINMFDTISAFQNHRNKTHSNSTQTQNTLLNSHPSTPKSHPSTPKFC